MSTTVQQLGSKFYISPSNIKAFEKTFSTDIKTMLYNCGWGIKGEEAITNIYTANCIADMYTGNYITELSGLRLIAPYVKSGSYLEFQDEYGKRFRYVFKNKQVHYINAKITWPKV